MVLSYLGNAIDEDPVYFCPCCRRFRQDGRRDDKVFGGLAVGFKVAVPQCVM